jgi:hypothetical protein
MFQGKERNIPDGRLDLLLRDEMGWMKKLDENIG